MAEICTFHSLRAFALANFSRLRKSRGRTIAYRRPNLSDSSECRARARHSLRRTGRALIGHSILISQNQYRAALVERNGLNCRVAPSGGRASNRYSSGRRSSKQWPPEGPNRRHEANPRALLMSERAKRWQSAAGFVSTSRTQFVRPAARPVSFQFSTRVTQPNAHAVHVHAQSAPNTHTHTHTQASARL